MANALKHKTQTVVVDDGTSPVGSDEWNEEHAFAGGTDGQVLSFLDSASDNAEWKTLFYETDIGNGSATSIVVTHSLGTRAVHVSVYAAGSPYAEVGVDVERTSTTTVTLTFLVAPTTNQYHVVVSL